ncbi:MAG: toxin-antitoxin system HicB family antitoxin [Candidatus Dormibacteraeota bacterium]|nr:toxin-antitoxin system HicB family antitoxin [Candidatus Dormibacteraeota bacterium]
MSEMVGTKNETVERLLDRPWSREFVPDDGLVAARVPELPGCFASGATWEEANANLVEALASWLSAAVELGNEIPKPGGEVEPEEFSGRFSARVPKSLHRQLSARAEVEGCSLNQLVTTVLAASVSEPVRKTSDADAYEEIAADAVAVGPESIGALKGIATFLRNRGDVNLACLIYAFAAERAASGPGGAQDAAKEFGTAGALARRERRMRLAEALWRQSLRRDFTNIRSNSSLGQLLHHQARYEEAIDYLERAASVDSYARLFLGWSRLQLGLNNGQETLVSDGLSDVTDALRKWAAYAPRSERSSWVRQVRRLQLLGARFHQEAEQLVYFANGNANWPKISSDELEKPSKLEEAELAEEDAGVERRADPAAAGAW